MSLFTLIFNLFYCFGQDDHGEFSVNMDTAVAIRTLEATYKSSADAAAVESMILKLTDKVYCLYDTLFALNTHQ